MLLSAVFPTTMIGEPRIPFYRIVQKSTSAEWRFRSRAFLLIVSALIVQGLTYQ